MAANGIEGQSRQVRRAAERKAAKAGRLPASRTLRSLGVPQRRAPDETPGKGLFDGNCNVTACQAPVAGDNWFNTSTRRIYCRRCAGQINTESLRYEGVEICVPVEGPEERPPFPSAEIERIRVARGF